MTSAAISPSRTTFSSTSTWNPASAAARRESSAPSARSCYACGIMAAAPGRNDPCPCGSGRKYKHCTSRRTATSTSLAPGPRDGREAGAGGDGVRAGSMGRTVHRSRMDVLRRVTRLPLADAPADREFETTFIAWWIIRFPRRLRQAQDPPPGMARAAGRPASILDDHRGGLSEDRDWLILSRRSPGPCPLLSWKRPRRGRSLDLRDVLTGRTCRVLERSASRIARALQPPARADHHDRRGVDHAGRGRLGHPAGLPQSHHHLPGGTRAVRRHDGRRGGARGAPAILVRFYRGIVDELMNPRLPKLVNTDGDPIAPTEVHVELPARTPREAFDRLSMLAYGPRHQGPAGRCKGGSRRPSRGRRRAWCVRGQPHAQGVGQHIARHDRNHKRPADRFGELGAAREKISVAPWRSGWGPTRPSCARRCRRLRRCSRRVAARASQRASGSPTRHCRPAPRSAR